MENASPKKWESWLVHLLSHPGDDDEVMLSKKIWVSVVVFTIGLVVILIVAWWLLANFPNALNLVFFVLILVISILTLFFFVRIFIPERMRYDRAETEKIRVLDAPREEAVLRLLPGEWTPLDNPEPHPDIKPLLLVIEDNPDVVRYLDELLRAKYHLRVAHGGEEGVGIALEQVPDIIISDIMMTKKDGIEVCKTLKNDIRTNHVPIILLTAKADMASRLSGLEAGADAYLAKPFNRQELEVELAKLLRLRETLKSKYRHPFSPAANGVSPGLNERFLRDVYSCLDHHYQDEAFGIQALHSMLGMSRTQLHRKLAALTGKPASHFIRSFRLEKARQLLRTTRMTVAEVAYAVGFKDAFYFSRAFSQEYGMAPSEARG